MMNKYNILNQNYSKWYWILIKYHQKRKNKRPNLFIILDLNQLHLDSVANLKKLIEHLKLKLILKDKVLYISNQE